MEKGKYVELLLRLKISSFVALTFTRKANDTLNDLAFECVCMCVCVYVCVCVFGCVCVCVCVCVCE